MKKPGTKTLLIVGIASILVVAAGGGILALTLSGREESREPAKQTEKELAVLNPVYVEIPPLTVSLNTPAGTKQLRLHLKLELEGQDQLKAAEVAVPHIVDLLQNSLRQFSIKELQGATGVQRVQTQLLSLIATMEHPLAVKKVLVQEMLIQ